MANTKSAKKSIIVNERNRQRNTHFKSKMKSAIKSALAAIQDKSDKAIDLTRIALKTIDKIAGKGIIHKKSAGRKKASLMGTANKSSLDLKTTPKATIKATPASKKDLKAETKVAPKTTKAPSKTKATETKAKAKPAAKKPVAKKKVSAAKKD